MVSPEVIGGVGAIATVILATLATLKKFDIIKLPWKREKVEVVDNPGHDLRPECNTFQQDTKKAIGILEENSATHTAEILGHGKDLEKGRTEFKEVQQEIKYIAEHIAASTGKPIQRGR